MLTNVKLTNAHVNTTGNIDQTGTDIADSGNRVSVADAATGVIISASSDPSLNHCNETVSDLVKQHKQ